MFIFKAEALMKPLYEKQQVCIRDDLFFMKQKISNACGTFSLFHSLANKLDMVDIGIGIGWIINSFYMQVMDRLHNGLFKQRNWTWKNVLTVWQKIML
jgi:hypothetical protein